MVYIIKSWQNFSIAIAIRNNELKSSISINNSKIEKIKINILNQLQFYFNV